MNPIFVKFLNDQNYEVTYEKHWFRKPIPIHRKRTVQEKIENFKKEFKDDYPWVDILDQSRADILDQANWGKHYFLIFPILDLYDGDQDDEIIHQLEYFVENNLQMVEAIGFENIKINVLYNFATQQTHCLVVTCKDQNTKTLVKLFGISCDYMLG